MTENIKKSQEVESNNNINSTNIFDDFSTFWWQIDKDLKKDEDIKRKDIYYYLDVFWKIFGYIFWLFLVLIIFLFFYLNYQKNPEYSSDKTYFNSVCWYIIWNVPLPSEYFSCWSITSVNNYYNEYLNNLKESQSSDILSMLNLVYERENLFNSKDLTFILDKSQNKFQVLSVLEKFDKIKNDFIWIYNKDLISCRDIYLDSNEKIISLKCEAFSSDLNYNIKWFSWDNNNSVYWTSITIASSFLNYIEKKSSDFTLVDKQKLFNITYVNLGNWITKKTDFDIKLKINF